MILNVSRNEFPASSASCKGMLELSPESDNHCFNFYEDVHYLTRGDRKLYLQIIRPLCSGRIPLIVYIPGSAFHKQCVKGEIPKLTLLANCGFAIALLEYRESELSPFPAQMLDAKAGIRYMKQHADEYEINPAKVFVMGDSSGGHTAMMAADKEVIFYRIPGAHHGGPEFWSSRVLDIISNFVNTKA